MYVLGIDTSCYTTSVALMDSSGVLYCDRRKLLEVPLNAVGLRQSEMVFQHNRNLPQLIEQVMEKTHEPISAIGVSTSPRQQAESYMPAFSVGHGYSRALSVMLHVPLYSLSHQVNHILAGIWSAKGPNCPQFLAVHASGGTTEIVKVTRGTELAVDLLGGTVDLAAGQLVDRIGSLLGLAFPAGKRLENLAKECNIEPADIPIAVKKLQVSFSGPESHVRRLLVGSDQQPSAIAAGLQISIARSFVKIICNAVEQTGIHNVLLVGGVLSNSFIKEFVREQIKCKANACAYSPERQYSSDNAVGAAYHAYLKLTSIVNNKPQ